MERNTRGGMAELSYLLYVSGFRVYNWTGSNAESTKAALAGMKMGWEGGKWNDSDSTQSGLNIRPSGR